MAEEEKPLESWKEIASYLSDKLASKDITTLIRWEKERGLPIHRIPGGKRSRVFAYKDELDEWLKGKPAAGEPLNPSIPAETSLLALTPPVESPALTSDETQAVVEPPVAAALCRHPSLENTSCDDVESLHHPVIPVFQQALGDGDAAPRRRPRAAAFWTGSALLMFLLTWVLWPPQAPEVMGYTQLTNDGRMKGIPIFTDGVLAYWEEYEGSEMVLASISSEGEEISTVRLPAGFLPTDVWPDGSKFLGDERRGRTDSLAVASPTGKSLQWLLQPPARPSGRYQMSVLGSWSPHGGKIALCYGHGVFEARSDGSRLRRLATLPGWPDWPRWSPDGRVLSFSVLSPKAEKQSLWQVGADGTHLHPLDFRGSRFSTTCFGSWTSDGKYFIFQARQDGHDSIWALRERGAWLRRSGARLVRLTSGPLDYRYPVPSRDRKVIFALGAQSRGELMRFDLKSHTFTDFLGGISAAEVSFSRDGKWVAYVRYPDYTLWRARADGSGATQLTFSPLEAREPRWSPDGTKIAFQGITQGPRYKIYVISRDGGEARQIIPGDGEESVATWSPDGQSLVYDEPLYRHDPSQMFIHWLDLKTGKAHKIPGTSGSWTARLSPDGRYITTLEADILARARHLYVLEASTGQRILTITMPDQISEPTWSRDGKYVYFATLGTPAPALYRVRVRDKKLEKLTSLDGFPVAGLWTGVAPDGSPLLLRNTSTQELYALRVRLP